ncbi:gamma-aminobutyric acid type B receptor subunit 1-like isoform X2 [Acropora millepora]|nr:gamma-aminobutyric acid type B receptor subunit 1-like isoform X2 [Acropora millepora]XP_029193494.2 gamma-aminobutyric acid type B receptor subunit 1-like isoform X2 [Acropora millepora]XP_029193495.2 gamma-aminobutyric acid type B receptor subunit 1-like isoform X2 [Acropora millepora]
MMSNPFMFILCYFLTTSSVKDVSSKKDLYIGGFFGVNITEAGAWSSAALIPALEMALDHVNNDSNILADYQLNYVWRDSKCESGSGIRAMLDMIDTKPRKIVFLGPGCSVATKPVAEAAPYWQAVQIGYSTSSPLFSNKEKFPLYFRTSTPETMENPSRLALLKHFKWKKVALIVQNLDIYVLTREELIPELESANITIIAAETFNNDPASSVKYLLKDRDARIIIGLMYEDMFRKAMCTAYKQQVFGNKYVWIIVGWYNEDWWKKRDVECNGEQLLEAAANLIETYPLPLSSSTEPTISKRTARQLDAEYRERIQSQKYSYNSYAAFTYDAAWSVALMLNKSIPLLREKNRTLETMTYRDGVRANIMRDILSRTEFWGMSGHVTFDEKGNRETLVQITQNRRGFKKVVATFDIRDGNLNLYNDSFVWEGGRIPSDGVTINEKSAQDNLATTITFYVLSCIGMLFCLCCLMLNFFYRKHMFIRMSSPKFNNITVVGCMLCYMEVFVSAYSGSSSATCDTQSSLCYINAFLLSTGFTLAFGGIFTKTWRVYKIFTNNQMKREIGVLSNTSLFLRLCVAWFVDIIILSIWAAVDPMTRTRQIISKFEDHDNDLKTTLYIYQCKSKHYLTWVLSFCGMKGVFLIFGVFLAWETRNVHYLALNDSKNIGLAVYNIFMFSCLALVIEFVVTYLPLATLVGRSITLVGTTSTICFLFVPKILHLKNNKVTSLTDVNHDKSDFANGNPIGYQSQIPISSLNSATCER